MIPYDLGTLPHDEAQALLLQICPRIGAEAPRLVELCGYLPLALRLSASLRANDVTRPIAAYLHDLNNRQKRLETLSDPDDPDLSIAHTLDLSYQALNALAQTVLAQLSVFPAPFDLPAARAVVALPTGSPPLADLLGQLYRHSLLGWDEVAARYTLHDLVRAFAATQLTDPIPVAWRHARHYADVTAQARTLYH
jgi:predicted ATPase